MADKHYTHDWSTGDIALQLASMVILNLDEADANGYDDGEILELVECFNNRLDKANDAANAIAIQTLNVYAVSRWNPEYCLTDPHLNVIAGVVHDWMGANDA